MISFFMKFLISCVIIFSVYDLFSKKEIKILEILILLFIFHICVCSIYFKFNIFILILSCMLIVCLYYFYCFLENKMIINKLPNDKILINRGIINFKELISSGYDYNELVYQLKKKGIKIDNVDYCIKKNNDLVIFRDNNIKNYPISLIIDGKLLKDNLFSINKNIDWLERKIDENELDLKNINYAYYKNQQVYFITDK